MARSRLLKPGFFKNEDLAQLEPHARLCFAGLWLLADREGRLEDRPLRIKTDIFPYEQLDLNILLDSLVQAGFITRYQSENHAYIAISTFQKHQTPHIKEAKSTIPAPVKTDTNTSLAQSRSPVSISRSNTDPVSRSTPDPVASPKTVPVNGSKPKHQATPKPSDVFEKAKEQEGRRRVPFR